MDKVALVKAAGGFLTGPQVQSQLKLALGNDDKSAKRLARVALTAITRNPKLLEAMATPQGQASLALALTTAAQQGVDVDGTAAHLVPYMNNRDRYMEVQLIMGWRAYIDRAYNHQKVKSVHAEVVYENDEFDYEIGLHPKLTHRPFLDGERGDVRYAYAVCQLTTGGHVQVVVGAADIKIAMGSSKSASSASSPWKSHKGAMWRKTAIRRLASVMPQSAELQSLFDHDNEVETIKDAATGALAKQAANQPFMDVETSEVVEQGVPTIPAKTAPPARDYQLKPAEVVVQQQDEVPLDYAAPEPPVAPVQAPASAPVPTPAPAPNPEGFLPPDAKTKAPAKAPQPAAQPAAAASPPPVTEEDVAALEIQITEAGADTAAVVAWAVKQFRLPPKIKNFAQIAQVAPARVIEIRDNLAKILPHVTA